MDYPPAIIFGLVGLIISPLALLLGYLRYRTKAGIEIFGSYQITSSMACADSYISKVTLENQKDRAVTIFVIYIRIGHNHYIELENFESSPLILKAYETYSKDYDPIEFYSVNMNRIHMDDLLSDQKVPKQLVLSTSKGKYRVPKRYRYWDPRSDFFNNHLIGTIHPLRLIHKEKAYGSNIIFLVDITLPDGSTQVIPVHSREYERKCFQNLEFTREAVESKANLEAFFKQEVESANLNAKKIIVHDLNESRARIYSDTYKKEITAKFRGRFEVFVVGWIFTKFSSWELRRRNKKNKQTMEKASVNEVIEAIEKKEE